MFVARGTETVAVEQGDGTYRLYGYKWFSSATDADMTFTLARVVDKQGQAVEVPSILLFVNFIPTMAHLLHCLLLTDLGNYFFWHVR